MYCIKQISPSVRTLLCPTFSVIGHNGTKKKTVRFSKIIEVYTIHPSTDETKRTVIIDIFQ